MGGLKYKIPLKNKATPTAMYKTETMQSPKGLSATIILADMPAPIIITAVG